VVVASKRPGFASLLRIASGLWSWTASPFCFLLVDSVNLVDAVRGIEEDVPLLRDCRANAPTGNRNELRKGQRNYIYLTRDALAKEHSTRHKIKNSKNVL